MLPQHIGTTYNQFGVYGEKGNASADHYPGARSYAVGWYDSLRQEFWLFGGSGFADKSALGKKDLLNDLWRYRMNDSTWLGSNQLGVYGEKGNASITNVPGARRDAVGWFDSLREELWLFGGFGVDSNAVLGALD